MNTCRNDSIVTVQFRNDMTLTSDKLKYFSYLDDQNLNILTQPSVDNSILSCHFHYF